jgi:hypothetical protein
MCEAPVAMMEDIVREGGQVKVTRAVSNRLKSHAKDVKNLTKIAMKTYIHKLLNNNIACQKKVIATNMAKGSKTTSKIAKRYLKQNKLKRNVKARNVKKPSNPNKPYVKPSNGKVGLTFKEQIALIEKGNTALEVLWQTLDNGSEDLELFSSNFDIWKTHNFNPGRAFHIVRTLIEHREKEIKKGNLAAAEIKKKMILHILSWTGFAYGVDDEGIYEPIRWARYGKDEELEHAIQELNAPSKCPPSSDGFDVDEFLNNQD